jgi:hypothetical protein
MANTHMGQPPKNHVTLVVIGVGSTGDPKEDLDFERIMPDGHTAPGLFRVPAGKVLVVTDVDWQYGSGTPARIQIFRIFNGGSEVFESSVILSDSGEGGISESMTSGFVLSSGRRIVVDTFPGGGTIQHVVIRGYLCSE